MSCTCAPRVVVVIVATVLGAAAAAHVFLDIYHNFQRVAATSNYVFVGSKNELLRGLCDLGQACGVSISMQQVQQQQQQQHSPG